MKHNSENKEEVIKENKSLGLDKLKASLRIFSYLQPYKFCLSLALILLIIGSVIMMAIMGVPGEMVKAASGNTTFFDIGLSEWGWIMVGLLIVRALISYFQTIIFNFISEKTMSDIRLRLYKNIICQDMSFLENEKSGELSSRLTADIEQLYQLFSVNIAEFGRQVVIFVFGVAALIYLMPRLFIIMLAIIPIVVGLSMIFGKYIKKLSRQRQDELATSNHIIEEGLLQIFTIKAFANEEYEINRYNNSITNLLKTSFHFAHFRGMFFGFILVTLFGSVFYILYQGAVLVQSGEMEEGTLFSFVIYTTMIGAAIASLGTIYTSIVTSLGASERILDLMERKPEIQLTETITPLKLKGDIKFKNIEFHYHSRPDFPVLHGINFDIKVGSSIALVGHSGSGKSTIAKLLMGIYSYKIGQIMVDDNEITQYNKQSYRKNIGIVPQEVMLFDGTIRQNLLYGKFNATDEELGQALQMANAWEFVSQFSEGLETKVGERGMQLSGGQKQRIAIARTILKDPKILILDEATSALDAESEKHVQDAIQKVMKNRTTLVIAHRLSTIKNVDKIIVIDKGSIVEQGNHDQLYASTDGVYRQLVDLQMY